MSLVLFTRFSFKASLHDCILLKKLEEYLFYNCMFLSCSMYSTIHQSFVKYSSKARINYTAGDYKQNQCPDGQLGCIPCTQRFPSCVSLMDGNEPFQGLLWQQEYITCDRDRTSSVERCDSAKIFNPNTKQCMDVKDLTKRK